MPVILAKQEASMLIEVMGSIIGRYILSIVSVGQVGTRCCILGITCTVI
jgi:hypothetical protein